MTMLYSISDVKISSTINEELTCSRCQTIGTSSIHIKTTYFHLLGIPFMPISKKGTSNCSVCNLELDSISFDKEAKEHFNMQISQSKNPIKLYSFTILLSILIVLAIVISVSL